MGKEEKKKFHKKKATLHIKSILIAFFYTVNCYNTAERYAESQFSEILSIKSRLKFQDFQGKSFELQVENLMSLSLSVRPFPHPVFKGKFKKSKFTLFKIS